jgi:hypothetical protein
MKTVLLVPGNKQGMDTHPYDKLVAAIEGVGYKVKFIQINWKYTTPSDWPDFPSAPLQFLKKPPNGRRVSFGFFRFHHILRRICLY